MRKQVLGTVAIVFLISSCAFKKKDDPKLIDRSGLAVSKDSDGDKIPDELERDQFERYSVNVPRFIPTEISDIDFTITFKEENNAPIIYKEPLYSEIKLNTRKVSLNTYSSETTGHTINSFRFVESYQIFKAQDEFQKFVAGHESFKFGENGEVKDIKMDFLVHFDAKDFYSYDSVKSFDVVVSAFNGKIVKDIKKQTFNTEEQSISGLTQLRLLDKRINTPILLEFDDVTEDILSDDLELMIRFENIIGVVKTNGDEKTVNISDYEKNVRRSTVGIYYISNGELKRFHRPITNNTFKEHLESSFETTELAGDSILRLDDDFSGGESTQISKLPFVTEKKLDLKTFKRLITNSKALGNIAELSNELIVIHETQREALEKARTSNVHISTFIKHYAPHAKSYLTKWGLNSFGWDFNGLKPLVSSSKDLTVKFFNTESTTMKFATRQNREEWWTRMCLEYRDHPNGPTRCLRYGQAQDRRYHCYKTWFEPNSFVRSKFSGSSLNEYSLSVLNPMIETRTINSVFSDSNSADILKLSRFNDDADGWEIVSLVPETISSHSIGRIKYENHCGQQNLVNDFTGSYNTTVNKEYYLHVTSYELLSFEQLSELYQQNQ
jgi:hypothetical protein